MPPVRKTVTVLFCDLAGSTELAERLDPEQLRDLLTRWYDAMRAPIEAHGGTVEKFVGDAVMAVFGVPQAHEDDALRAVRAASEMRDAVRELNEAPFGPRHVTLSIRIGINTGEVMSGGTEATLVTGDAVNTAKRLEEAAPPGEILVGSSTRRLVENAAELEAVAPLAAKGKRRPLEAWRVIATIPGADAFARRLDAPLIGRVRELEVLREELARAERDRVCRLVTVLGPAGIGKSRLASELSASLTARCLPYGDGISLLPLDDLVRSAGGEDAVLRAIETEPDGALIAERVCGGASSSEELQWAVRRLLEVLARERPLVVCIEDVHWAQPAFLDLLEYIEGWTRDAPVLLLCLARPELLDIRPRWPGTALSLAPLDPDEARALLDALAAEWPVDEGARAQVLETAEGNPLFVEQMVAMLGEHGGVLRELPPTIQALLAARLDGLEPDERGALERAAVIGRDFTRDAVAALAEGGEVATLLELVRKDLLRPASSPYAGDDGFRFRHALIRDAAYAEIPKRVRADLHERVADWLADRGADDELVGYHLEQSFRMRSEVGLDGKAVGTRAGELLGDAGVRASARGDAVAARDLLQRALAVLPPRHPQRAHYLAQLGESLWIAGDLDASEHALSESIALARADGDTRLEWYGRLQRAGKNMSSDGDSAALEAVARRAVEVFEPLDDDLGLARAWRRIAFAAFHERRLADAAAAAERALTHALASGDPSEHARAADTLCSSLYYGPTPVPETVERVEQLLAGTGSNIVLRANVSTTLGGLVAMAGDFARARSLVADAMNVFDELGQQLPRVGCMEIAADVERLAGNNARAVEILRSGYAILDDGGYQGWRAMFASMLALMLAEDGETFAARMYAKVCATSMRGADTDTAARAQAAAALLDHDRTAAAAAVAFAEQTDSLNLQAQMHLVLARITGDEDEAATARALFRRKGNIAAEARIGLWSMQPQ